MKHTLPACIVLLLLLLLGTTSSAQYCDIPNRFSQQEYFTDNQIAKVSDVVYGNALNRNNQQVVLDMNIFFPKMVQDTLVKRPFVMMIHGGGFVGGTKEMMDDECKEFAKRGFVAATIKYRLGHNGSNCTDTNSYNKAVYRAIQDAHAAFRFIVANADTLRIDTAWMFIGGGSAGAGTALCLVYLSQQEFDTTYPAIGAELGNLNNSGNSLTGSFRLNGIFNNWGAIGRDFMGQTEALPTVAFQGEADSTVYIDSAYGNECLTAPPLMYGPRAIHQKLGELGVCSDLTVDPNGGHGIYNNSPSRIAFRVGRASCFFKSIFCNNCTTFYSTDSIAADCNNLAVGLVPMANSDGQIFIYPNPASSQINVAGLSSNGVEVSVSNNLGQVLAVYNNTSTIDITQLVAGLYFVSVQSQGHRYIQRVIKQ